MKRPVSPDPVEWRAARNERQRFDELYRRHAPAMWRAAYHVLRNQEEAWDVVQRAFVKILEKPEQLQGLLSVDGWVVTVARNQALDLWRQRRPQTTSTDERDADERRLDPQAQTLANEDMRRLAAALERLSDEERELLRLRVQEGFDHEAIAAALGRRSGSIRVALHRARKKLEQFMEDDHDQT
jgi:RNA polymerase sigma-70 factor (ECF subfamily)